MFITFAYGVSYLSVIVCLFLAFVVLRKSDPGEDRNPGIELGFLTIVAVMTGTIIGLLQMVPQT